MQVLRGTSERSSKGNVFSRPDLYFILRENFRSAKKTMYRPFLRGLCINMICFYQRRLSHHTCLYTPSCSEYTKRCINNLGVVRGILLGMWRILRCNPLSKGGIDPAPERYCKVRWLL